MEISIWQAVLLGILQGASEFLPISSSGHLVLGQQLMGLSEPNLFLDTSLHMGTLGAVLIVFRNDLWQMLLAVFRWRSIGQQTSSSQTSYPSPYDHRQMVICVMIGSIPTAVIGLGLKSHAETLFGSVGLVGLMLLVTSTILWRTKNAGKTSGSSRLSPHLAVGIGLIQGLAVIPGISRSGTTIAAGMFGKLDRDLAARFSFLLSIPAIMGAECLSIIDIRPQDFNRLFEVGMGTLAAFVSGLIALKLLLRVVHAGRLYWFAPYCTVIGLLALAAGFLG